MNCSTPGFPVLHFLSSFAQTQVHWVDNAIQLSSSVAPFSSCPQSFPVSGSFSSFISGGQSNGASASVSVLPVNIQGWSPVRLTCLISILQGTFRSRLKYHSLKTSILWCPWDFQESSPTPQSEGINSLAFCFLYGPALTTVSNHWEDYSLDYTDFVGRVHISAFNTLSRFVIILMPVGQEATVRTLYGITDWFKMKKGVGQGCLLSPCCLTYILSTSWEMLSWMSYKLESR